ncbi:MAG: efflux RND transporter periplasmic adaptor subunit [Akkermansiaceae bacterium]|nr:efflux RND transporter periplasmic adaptor subunit [Akkermansiaceae bacterium]
MKDEEATEPKADDSKQEEQRIMAIHAVKSFVLALVILAVASVLAIVLVLTKEDPKKKQEAELVTSVRVQPIERGSHQVLIETQGAVRSLHEVQLAAEVGGRVESKSTDLVAGAAVSQGQVLLELDATDYKAAAARAATAVAEAKVALQQEQAMAKQAAIDWEKLGRGEPSDLALRKPQLEAARKRLESAREELQRAQKDVERTSIHAPFDARVRRVAAEVGAVLAPGTPVAELYSTEELEVRLPFTLLDYGFLKDGEAVELTLTATVGGEEKSWPAVLDRLDGEVQRSTLSAYGMARVKRNAAGELPPVGLFVEAEVPGKVLEDVVELPRSAVRSGKEVWVERDGKLARCEITILRSSEDEVVVRGEAFEEGDRLMLTRLATPMPGMKVEAMEDTPEE